MSLLVADNVTKRFGDVVALDGLSLEVEDGVLVGAKHPRLEFWLTRAAAVLAVGSFVFWALE